MPSLSYSDDSVINYTTGTVINSMDITNIQKERNVFGLHTDMYYKRLYEMYSVINNCVYRTMEYSLGLTHDLYIKWLDFKSSLGEDYTKFINSIKKTCSCTCAKGDTLKRSPEIKGEYYDSFSFFMSVFLASSDYSDLSMCINQKDYIRKVFELNDELEKEFGATFRDYDIHYKIGCIHNEFPMIKDQMRTFGNYNNINSIAFTVVPELNEIQAPLNNQYQNSSISISQHIYFDINRMICTFIDSYDPSRLPKHLEDGEQDKKEYILNGLDKFKNLSELITRRIELELFDNHENACSNWGSFISKLNKHYSCALKNDEISLLINKLTHYNMVCSDTILNSLIDAETYNERSNPVVINMRNFNGLLENIYNSYFTVDESPINAMGKSLICKLFSKAFSTSVKHHLYYDYDNQKCVLNGYTRDFYQKYSINDLLEETMKISDYNIKDFFQSIIKEDIGWMQRIYGAKLKSGEYAFFMYSKTLRNVWFDLASYFYAVLNIDLMCNTCKQKVKTSSNVTLSVDKKISEMIFSIFNNLKQLYLCDGTSNSLYLHESDLIPSFSLLVMLRNAIVYSSKFKTFSTEIDRLIIRYNNKIHDNTEPQDITKFNTKYIRKFGDDSELETEYIIDIINGLLKSLISNGIMPIIDD